MKRFDLFLAAALVGAPAFASSPASAQDYSLAYRGTGTRAGGPAYLLNRGGEALAAPLAEERQVPRFRLRSGTVAGGPGRDFIIWPGPVSLEGTVYDPHRSVPFGQSGSGQRAGGPFRF